MLELETLVTERQDLDGQKLFSFVLLWKGGVWPTGHVLVIFKKFHPKGFFSPHNVWKVPGVEPPGGVSEVKANGTFYRSH